MVKATIQNNPYCTEMAFPCTETELLKKLDELGIDKEHLAPTGMVIDIEPAELSMLMDCEVSLDALNYLGKRMDGMEKLESEQFLAVLSCDELNMDWGLKNIINLTFNLPRYTLIKDTNDFECAGRRHLFNIRGYLSASEAENKEWLAEEGKKLINSGKGIDTEYGKLFVNEEIPFEEIFKGTAFPPYYCDPDAVVSVEVSYNGETELVDLPNEDIVIKKTLARLGANSIGDCELTVDGYCDIADEWREKIKAVENTKDLYGLNNLLKTEDIRIKQEQPVSIFNKEVTKKLSGEGYDVTADGEWLTVALNGNALVKINDSDIVYTDGDFYDKDKSGIASLSGIVRNIYEYCSSYEKAVPLKAEHLSGNYRCLSEFNGTVLAAKYSEQNEFEFVTWDRTFDGKAVCQGNYHTDYTAAKEDFATRSGLVDSDRLFDADELKRIHKCIGFALENDDSLDFNQEKELSELKERIDDLIPSQAENQEQGFQGLVMQ